MLAKENLELHRIDKINKNKLQKTWRGIKKHYFLYIILVPGILYFLIFRYIPMWGLAVAFKNYYPLKGFSGSEWVGLENFISFFQSTSFIRVLRNTLILSVYEIVFQFPVPIIFALMLNEIINVKFKKAVQTISYLPHFISTVVVVGMISAFLSPSSGPLSQLIKLLGGTPKFYMAQAESFRSIFVISGIWQNMGWGSIIYLASLAGVDVELYEAAIVDGAGKWRQLWNITLPSIMPVIVVMLVLALGKVMSVGFEKIFLMMNPLTYETADVISTYVYRRGMLEGSFGFATAVGFFNSVINFILIVISNYLSKKVTHYGIW